ncbi:hypothetical protein AQJ91_19080 [Streptomyces dysideae]|uniref:non-reducing end alpha-L-arabinofuranosidase n=1 Tax=Streptomyces dysideae TaxID=909626 RepID=A0A101UZ20_9ACTN|nr:non-reducing end alpha-L-arabinofuranosidase family hydrolase [Streptomyces dysideae]KUO19469.1 hypothetical protein AQJ91_19080 [Streptomyces dysideae]
MYYKVAGSNQYLLLQEAIGSTGRRYFRSFTSTRTWTPLAATENEPFAQSLPTAVPLPGHGPSADGDHLRLPWRMGLLTQTNSPCRPPSTQEPLMPPTPLLRHPRRLAATLLTGSLLVGGLLTAPTAGTNPSPTAFTLNGNACA